MDVELSDITELYNGYAIDDLTYSLISTDDFVKIMNVTPQSIFFHDRGYYSHIDNEKSCIFIVFSGIVTNEKPVTIRIPLFAFSEHPEKIERPKSKNGMFISPHHILFIEDYLSRSVMLYKFEVRHLLAVNKYIFGKIWHSYIDDIGCTCVINRE